MRETCRLSDTELLPSDVPDGPIWFKSVLQSIISKTWSPYECPYQLDMMTKTLQVKVDKFPWLCASKFILHSFHWISSIFPSLFNCADKWSVAVIQSISCLSGHTLDSFIVADEVRFFSSGSVLQLCTDFYVMHWNHIYSCATYRSLYKTEKRHSDSEMETNILMFSLTLCPGTKATASKEWRRSSTCCWPPPPVSACSNSNPRSLSASKLLFCWTLVRVRQHVRVCVLTVFVTFLWNIFRKTEIKLIPGNTDRRQQRHY